VTDFILQSSCL